MQCFLQIAAVILRVSSNNPPRHTAPLPHDRPNFPLRIAPYNARHRQEVRDLSMKENSIAILLFTSGERTI